MKTIRFNIPRTLTFRRHFPLWVGQFRRDDRCIGVYVRVNHTAWGCYVMPRSGV